MEPAPQAAVRGVGPPGDYRGRDSARHNRHRDGKAWRKPGDGGSGDRRAGDLRRRIRPPGVGRRPARSDADEPKGQVTFRASVLTLYPEMFPGPLGASLAGRALDEGIWSL